MLATGDRPRREQAYCRAVGLEFLLVAAAEIHRRTEVHGEAVTAGLLGQAHSLKPNDPGRGGTHRRFTAREPNQALAAKREDGIATAATLQAPGNVVVTPMNSATDCLLGAP